MITLERLAQILPAAGEQRIALYHPALSAAMEMAGISSPLRIAHFLAQVGHESGDLRFVRELADGRAYEGRKDLGNTEPGDGPRFKGRGLIQLTGRANYAAFGAAVGEDLTRTEGAWDKVAADPALAVGVATWFWSIHKLNALADEDALLAITRRINGGVNGLADRQARLDRAKACLAGETESRA